MSLGHRKMTFCYENSFATANALEGYERLILLAMVGDHSLFTSSDGNRCGRSPPRCWTTHRRSSPTSPAQGAAVGRPADLAVPLASARKGNAWELALALAFHGG